MRLIPAALALGCAVLLCGPAIAQGGAPGVDLDQAMDGLGLGDKEKTVVRLLVQATDMDPAQALVLVAMGAQGSESDPMGILMMSQVFRASGAKQPTAVIAGDKLLIIEGGMIYRVNLADLKVESSAAYRPPKKGAIIPAELAPVIKEARENALLSDCLSNMKQLCVAALMYAQDMDEKLPTEGWVEQIAPYHKDHAICVCPGAPGKQLGYALNERVSGAKMGDIAAPAETILFFESDRADAPFGGPEELIRAPRHAGLVVIGFVDGHAKAMPAEEARKLLDRDIKKQAGPPR